jgi:hypothetical protein
MDSQEIISRLKDLLAEYDWTSVSQNQQAAIVLTDIREFTSLPEELLDLVFKWGDSKSNYAGMTLEEFLQKIGYQYTNEQITCLRRWLNV